MSFVTDLYICLMTVRIVLLGQERAQAAGSRRSARRLWSRPGPAPRARLSTQSTKLQTVAHAGP
jgi:hypothetical protein